MQPAKPSQAQLAICDVSAESVTAVLWHAGKREEGEGGGSGGHAGLRLLSALLTEMDGMELATGAGHLLLLLLLLLLSVVSSWVLFGSTTKTVFLSQDSCVFGWCVCSCDPQRA